MNRTYREDVLDAWMFEDLEDARILSDEWQYKYNHLLPHDSLNNQTPAMAMESLPAALHSNQVIEQEQHRSAQQKNIQSRDLNE